MPTASAAGWHGDRICKSCSSYTNFYFKGELQRKNHPMFIFDRYVALASHVECITTIFIIKLYVVFELSLVKHCKTSLPQK